MYDVAYIITGIVPYSVGERGVIAVYLDRDRAVARMDRERTVNNYIDISMDEYGIDG